MFSLQVLHTKLHVSLCGLQRLDFPLVLGMTNAVFTYVVIMIQFYNKRGPGV
jgi:hypothetical protein